MPRSKAPVTADAQAAAGHVIQALNALQQGLDLLPALYKPAVDGVDHGAIRECQRQIADAQRDAAYWLGKIAPTIDTRNQRLCEAKEIKEIRAIAEQYVGDRPAKRRGGQIKDAVLTAQVARAWYSGKYPTKKALAEQSLKLFGVTLEYRQVVRIVERHKKAAASAAE